MFKISSTGLYNYIVDRLIQKIIGVLITDIYEIYQMCLIFVQIGVDTQDGGKLLPLLYCERLPYSHISIQL